MSRECTFLNGASVCTWTVQGRGECSGDLSVQLSASVCLLTTHEVATFIPVSAEESAAPIFKVELSTAVRQVLSIHLKTLIRV